MFLFVAPHDFLCNLNKFIYFFYNLPHITIILLSILTTSKFLNTTNKRRKNSRIEIMSKSGVHRVFQIAVDLTMEGGRVFELFE